mgnify:CR=1 FL=1
MKTFTNITLRLTEAEGRLVQQLKAKGITQIEIFRQGLALCQKAEFKPLKVPAKVVAKAKGIVR